MPSPPGAGGRSQAKAALRKSLLARRQARRPDPQGDAERTRTALAACVEAGTVAAYVSTPTEPDTWALLDALWRSGRRVLLPVLRLPPSWGYYAGTDRLETSPKGIYQPDGPILGPDELSKADWIWLPGLAGTPAGRRLGTGGGWYDRALALSQARATRGLLLFDDEVFAELPGESWDQPVDLIVTETRRLDCQPD